jgi:hypothetical protein
MKLLFNHPLTRSLLLLLCGNASLQAQTPADTVPQVKAMILIYYEPKFSLTVSGTGNYTFRRLQTDTEQPLVDCRNAHESATLNVSPRLEFGYRISNRCWIDVGVQYQRYGFNTSETVTLNNQSDIQIFAMCDVNDVVAQNIGFIYYGYFDPRFAFTIQNAVPGDATVSYKFRYDFLELPISFRQNWALGKARISWRIGITNSYLLRNASTVTYTGPGESYLIWNTAESASGVKLPGVYNRFNIAPHAGFDFFCPLNDTWHLRGGVEAAYQLQPLLLLQPVNENHYRAGVTLGVVYRFPYNYFK